MAKIAELPETTLLMLARSLVATALASTIEDMTQLAVRELKRGETVDSVLNTLDRY